MLMLIETLVILVFRFMYLLRKWYGRPGTSGSSGQNSERDSWFWIIKRRPTAGRAESAEKFTEKWRVKWVKTYFWPRNLKKDKEYHVGIDVWYSKARNSILTSLFDGIFQESDVNLSHSSFWRRNFDWIHRGSKIHSYFWRTHVPLKRAFNFDLQCGTQTFLIQISDNMFVFRVRQTVGF